MFIYNCRVFTISEYIQMLLLTQIIIKEMQMSAYIVVNSTILNQEKMQEYANADKQLEKYNGKVITIGNLELLSGDNNHKSMLIIEFESKEKANEWFFSKQYQELKINVLDKAVSSTFTLCGI